MVDKALRFARTEVTITSRVRDPRTVDIYVDDDGPGWEAGQAHLMFEPGTTSATGLGSGLGLAMARRIARTVGGDVMVVPAEPLTRFVVRLPRG